MVLRGVAISLSGTVVWFGVVLWGVVISLVSDGRNIIERILRQLWELGCNPNQFPISNSSNPNYNLFVLCYQRWHQVNINIIGYNRFTPAFGVPLWNQKVMLEQHTICCLPEPWNPIVTLWNLVTLQQLWKITHYYSLVLVLVGSDHKELSSPSSLPTTVTRFEGIRNWAIMRLFVLGKTSCKNKCFHSGIARIKKYTLYIPLWQPKKMYKLPERRGGGRGNSGNARKKTFFFSGGVP